MVKATVGSNPTPSASFLISYPHGLDVYKRQVPELREWLEVYAGSTDTAAEWADKHNLSRPIKTRAIAPTGTIGIIGETTTGCEPLFCVAYKRRFLDTDMRWKFQYVIDPIAHHLIEEKGIDPDQIEDAYSLSYNVERRLRFQADLQGYVDHAIASTILSLIHICSSRALLGPHRGGCQSRRSPR